jgi:hypothetical protein
MTDIYADSKISFQTLCTKYASLQLKVKAKIASLASSISNANPAKFLLAQFYMSQLTQVGESISNLISQVNSVINYAVRAQKTQ